MLNKIYSHLRTIWRYQWHSFRQNERGNVTIEMAMVFSTLAFMALGSIDFGRLMYEQIRMEQLARTGVQMGLRSQSNAIDLENIKAGVMTAAGSDNDGLAVAASNTCECPETAGTATSCLEICVDETYPMLFLNVTVTRDYQMIFGVPGFVEGWTLSADANVRVR